ncbi:protease modulator HflC [Fimbriiglobus ruber]|uniref:Protein HflC n=1 Tax=Fimbriiglobus ruber TaxID=1908690 RepID=A0A225EGV9_9BACT|nr:protease modulator HflC [Fimbriiglobus ruber]OWK47437.1 HflC protein [Fimbriiglobus ruber]
MKRLILFVVLPLVLLLWGRTAFYAVDYAEFAYVTRFGEPVATHDGTADAGLHVKWPWPVDSVLRIDHRLQTFDLPAVESLTRDPKNKTVDKTLAADAFVTWRVPDAAAADRFVRTVGTPEQARRVLGPRINGRLATVISNMPIDELIAVADERAIDARTDTLRRRLLGEEGTGERVREAVLAEYGIEIVDLRLRRFSYPEAVRASIAERIRSERARKVADYESEGRKRATDILSSAEKEARTIEADARAQKQLTEGRADVEADRIRNDAHARDRDFYVFLQKLKAYQLVLSDTRDVLLLSTKHPLFDLLLNPPKAPDQKPAPKQP